MSLLLCVQDIAASGMLGGMQLVTIPIDPKWKPYTVITRIREIIASQNSTHVFVGAWAVRDIHNHAGPSVCD